MGITAVDPERDLVVLKISGAHAPALALGDSESVQVGETVYAVGNPQGLEGTFSQGSTISHSLIYFRPTYKPYPKYSLRLLGAIPTF